VSEPAADRPIRWTGRSYLLLASALALFGVGVVARSPVPLLLAFPILLAPLAAPLMGPRGRPTVAVETRVEGSGREVRATVRLVPSPGVRPADLLPTFERVGGLLESRSPQESADDTAMEATFFWRLPDPTVAVVPPPLVRWQDALGLAEREVSVQGGEIAIERYPPELHHAGAVRLHRTIALPGETRSRAIGEAGEFYGIREAAPGDPMRRLNLRASARLGQRLVNEYVLDRTGDLIILIDARPSVLGSTTGGRLLGISKAAAFGLAETFLRAKSRVGVAVYGEFLDAVPLSTGRAHRLRIRNLLLAAPLAREPGPAERGAIALRRYFPRGATTVILSPLADEEGVDLVLHVRRRGFPAVVLSPSAVPLLPELGLLTREDGETVERLARLLRRQQISRAWSSAPVIDWEDYWSLGGFVQFLSRPSGRERGV
jgi:uncharacterized protein (DUF58 family)